jgi:phosphate transport system permease protein
MESGNRGLIHYIDKDKILNKANTKTKTDIAVRSLLFLLALISASAVIFIIVFIAIQGLKPFFTTYTVDGVDIKVSFWHFLTGMAWTESGSEGYGVGYIIINTIYIALLTILLTAPISIMTALVIVKMTPKWLGGTLNAIIEILASVPSVIFGMFGQAWITKMVKGMSEGFGFQSAGGLSTLAVVLVLTMMSVPTVTMLSITAIKSVNKNLELGSLALGASRSETNFKVVLSSARSGIFAGLILGISRALGEATAVTMVCGNAGSGPNFNLFSTTRTLTTTMLQGFGEATGLKYDIRFSVGLMLILIILLSNLILNLINRKLSKGSTK